MNTIKGNSNKSDIIESKIIENFFKVWITKELIHKSYFNIYFKTFLNSDNNFDMDKYQIFLNEIYNLISTYETTFIRPNNLDLLDEKTISSIIKNNWEDYVIPDRFSQDIITLIEWKNIKTDSDYELSNNLIDITKNWLKEFLNILYNNWTYSLETEETIDEIVEKTIKIIKQN